MILVSPSVGAAAAYCQFDKESARDGPHVKNGVAKITGARIDGAEEFRPLIARIVRRG